jgi:hypothetical protein
MQNNAGSLKTPRIIRPSLFHSYWTWRLNLFDKVNKSRCFPSFCVTTAPSSYSNKQYYYLRLCIYRSKRWTSEWRHSRKRRETGGFASSSCCLQKLCDDFKLKLGVDDVRSSCVRLTRPTSSDAPCKQNQSSSRTATTQHYVFVRIAQS